MGRTNDNGRMPTGRRMVALVVTAAALGHAGAMAQETPGIKGQYTWDYYIPGKSGGIHEGKPVLPVDGKLFYFKQKAFEAAGGAGPRSTKSDVTVSGYVNAARRKLGASVEVNARLVPWDPDAKPGTLYEIMTTEATAQVALEDEILVSRPGVPAGQKINFEIQPTHIAGLMSVPPRENGDIHGNGVATLTVYFTFYPVGEADAGRFIPLEKNLPDGTEFSWPPPGEDAYTQFSGELAPLAIQAETGKRYFVRLFLYVAGGLIADGFHPKDPPTHSVKNSFRRTVTWTGFKNFRDASGQPLNDVTITSTIGFDWKTLRTTPPPPEVVEYYNASLDHYFITPLEPEQDNLDAGKTPTPWIRTGESFGYVATAGAGASPVCRFYIPPALGDSHFFGRGSAECDATAAKNPSFTLEAPAFVHMILPTAGTCPEETEPVYRVFSNRLDANHRYTTSKTIRDQMVAKGWLAEGDGPDLVVMCAPK